MSIFKRTVTSIFSKVDKVVGEIENHDALIKAAIADQRKKIAAAKVDLARLKSNARKVSSQIEQLEAKQHSWAERAVREASDDESKALACMQQREAVTQEAAKLREMLRQYESAAQKLEQEISLGDTQLLELTQKHQIMRARQSTATAMNNIGELGGGNFDDLETSFDRWEVKIAQGEYTGNDALLECETDTLEQGYIKEENEQHLKAELARLLDGGPGNV